MAAITKADLIQHLFNVIGLNKREAKEIVELFFDEIVQALTRGETVKLADFGVFKLKDKAPRVGRNPKTGETVTITARRVALFKAHDTLKNKIAHYAPIIIQTNTEKS
jgi:integration host factor subunit alpha